MRHALILLLFVHAINSFKPTHHISKYCLLKPPQLTANSPQRRTRLALLEEQGQKVPTPGEEQEFYEDIEDDSDLALINRLEDDLFRESGVYLEDLINPTKVVNLSRDIARLETEMNELDDSTAIALLQEEIEKKTQKLNVEKRGIMRGWLKGLFVGQSILAAIASLIMVYDVVPRQTLPLPVKVLGFWMWWLFIIPSLRARKPSAKEKEALNIAFLGTPLVSILLPSFTKDVVIIWWANAIFVALSYAWAFLKTSKADPNGDDNLGIIGGNREGNVIPPILVKAFKALDYGSGRERGARK